MADAASSRRNRFKVDRVNSGGGSEGDGDNSEVSKRISNARFCFLIVTFAVDVIPER